MSRSIQVLRAIVFQDNYAAVGVVCSLTDAAQDQYLRYLSVQEFMLCDRLAGRALELKADFSGAKRVEPLPPPSFIQQRLSLPKYMCPVVLIPLDHISLKLLW
ncbi:hypothetical protein BDW68DRAFT_150224 [Aspergillus falconensis]